MFFRISKHTHTHTHTITLARTHSVSLTNTHSLSLSLSHTHTHIYTHACVVPKPSITWGLNKGWLIYPLTCIQKELRSKKKKKTKSFQLDSNEAKYFTFVGLNALRVLFWNLDVYNWEEVITFLLSGQTKTHEVKKSVLFVVNDIYKKYVFLFIFLKGIFWQLVFLNLSKINNSFYSSRLRFKLIWCFGLFIADVCVCLRWLAYPHHSLVWLRSRETVGA